MTRLLPRLPLILTISIGLALVIYGPIPQPMGYHDFADRRYLLGIPNAADVISNAGFVLIGAWAFVHLWPARRDPGIAAAWPGYRLFLLALILTGAGSTFYHLAP